MEQQVECRITYSYGINKGRQRSGFESATVLRRHAEEATGGLVHLDKVEFRLVTRSDWIDQEEIIDGRG